jgi:hypothetical protein
MSNGNSFLRGGEERPLTEAPFWRWLAADTRWPK